MSEQKKKRFFLNHKKSSALAISVIIHVVFIVVAITFVAVQVYIKPEQTFEVVDVNRPKMKLRKLQVPVKQQKKSQAPKLRKTIVTKKKTNIDIQMPEIVGIKGGTGYGSGGGLGGLGFGFEMDLFGSGGGTGNEFVGTFYDLKQTPEGEQTDIGEWAARETFNRDLQLKASKVIGGFISSGCNPNRLKNYYKAPKLKYATAFMMPPMAADAAPKAFGVEGEVKPSYWVCHYRGQIAAPEAGRYRFCGIADDILVVRVQGQGVVLDASWPELIDCVTSWGSDDDDSRKYPLDSHIYGSFQKAEWQQVYDQLDGMGVFDGNEVFGAAIRRVDVNGNREYFRTESYMKTAFRMVMGDWIDLRKGQKVTVDVVISEIPGGHFGARLLIEQQGKNYNTADSDAGTRKVLPIFKTIDIDPKIVQQMKLDPNSMTLDGPSFSPLENAPE